MNKVTDYTVIFDFSIDRIVAKVKDKILEGWQPQGGISVVIIDFHHGNGPEPKYVQAMVGVQS
jgi:hypothetical protein